MEIVNVTEDDSVVKKMIDGGNGIKPTKGQQIEVHYEGRLEDGTVFDCSYDREPLEVAIGTGAVIKGWDLGIMAMEFGEKAELWIKSEYGYGENGSPPKIPGGATLIFTCELIKQMSDAERSTAALAAKEKGNAEFKNKSWDAAENHYSEAVENLDAISGELSQEQKDLKRNVLQNWSVVTNNTKNYQETILNCTKAIYVDPKATKAFYLRSVAFLNSSAFDDALADIKEAIKLSPKDKQLRTHFELVKKQRAEALKSEQASMAKLFSSGIYNDKKIEAKQDEPE